mmetsp:Transcript_20896/g.67293  ORF Transcript_20896/g.67293 Transcript_20896/m.67293 type:complete len:245 (+) Transcript_20896:68-802(+)
MGPPPLELSQLRVKKDLVELASSKFECAHASTQIEVQSPDHVLVSMSFRSGFYAGGTFVVALAVPKNYPFRPPKATCLTPAWHPNIELTSGSIAHPLLDCDWKPVQSMNAVILGLQLLFLEPNPEHGANTSAARTLAQSRELFAAQVRLTLRGGRCFGVDFPPQWRTLKREREHTHHLLDDDRMNKNPTDSMEDDVGALHLGEDKAAEPNDAYHHHHHQNHHGAANYKRSRLAYYSAAAADHSY